MNARPLTLIVMLCFASIAHADQAAYVTSPQAKRAAALFAIGSQARLFCEPCGDKTWKTITVQSKSVKKPSGKYYELWLNGNPVDLAYVYFYDKPNLKWRNVAKFLEIDVHDVSEFLNE